MVQEQGDIFKPENILKQFPNACLAKLPDGYTEYVFPLENDAKGVYLTVEGGEAFDEEELEFLDENYLKNKIKELLRVYSKENILKVVEELS